MSNRSQVTSLYRRALKLSLDWTIHRNLWRGQAMYLRDLFEANKHVTDPRQQKVIIKQTEDLLEKWKHPDPYRAPTAPGGSKYERNLPAHILEPPKDEDTKHLYESPKLAADLQEFLKTTTSEQLRQLAKSGEKVAIPGVKDAFIQRSEQKEAAAH